MSYDRIIALRNKLANYYNKLVAAQNDPSFKKRVEEYGFTADKFMLHMAMLEYAFFILQQIDGTPGPHGGWVKEMDLLLYQYYGDSNQGKKELDKWNSERGWL